MICLAFQLHIFRHWQQSADDNRVTVASQASVNLYLDVINLFLYILQLLGRHQRN
jgi:FtsH-binding integral membrane protein